MRLCTSRLRQWPLALLIIIIATGLQAQEQAKSSVNDETAFYREELAKRDRLIEELQRRYQDLEARLNRFEASEANHHSTVGTPNPDKPLATAVHDQAKTKEPTPARTSGVVPEKISQGEVKQLTADNSREQDRLIRSAFENTLVDRGGLLLPQGTYDIETSLTYIHSSAENIVIDGFTIFPILIVGDIVSERLTRDVNLFNLAFRMGLPWDSQVEIRIPYGHQKLRSSSADGAQRELNDNGLGDIELTFAHQLYRGSSKWPDLVANLRWKSITGDSPFSAADGDIFVGSGYHSTNISLNAVKVIDPVVYFAGFSYTFNNSTIEEVGKFEPGDNWGFNVGMAIALNLNNSLSFAYDQQFTSKSRLDGEQIPGSYSSTGVFSIGSSFLVTDSLSVDMSLGVGVTEDSPDLLLSASLPIRRKF